MLTSAARCYHSDHIATAKCPLNILVCYILIVLLQLTISSTTNISFCFNIYLFILSAPFFVICGQVVVQSLRLLPHFLVNFFVIFCFYFFFATTTTITFFFFVIYLFLKFLVKNKIKHIYILF